MKLSITMYYTAIIPEYGYFSFVSRTPGSSPSNYKTVRNL